MGDLKFENILGEQDIDTLFTEPGDTSAEETVEKPEENSGEKELSDTNKTTEVVNPEDLFGDEGTQPESVGSEKKGDKEKGDATTEEGSGSSPKNFYSSIANALAVDGIFPNLDEEAVQKATDAESFSQLIEDEINARLDEKQRRISQALDNGVEASDIRKYENTLNYISSITDALLMEEGDKGEQLRRNIIFQDYLNKGYSQERAQKLTERSIDAGTDIEDAKDALQSNKEFFQEQYNRLLKEAQEEAERDKAERQKQEAKLKKSILEDKQLLGDMELSNEVRRKVYENISKPVYRDPETGQYMTALQRYEQEHHEDFIKYVGLFMTLTDGFKDFKSFAKAEVRKEMKKGLRELEQTLNNTRRNSDGSLNFTGGRQTDPESFLDGGFKLAL